MGDRGRLGAALAGLRMPWQPKDTQRRRLLGTGVCDLRSVGTLHSRTLRLGASNWDGKAPQACPCADPVGQPAGGRSAGKRTLRADAGMPCLLDGGAMADARQRPVNDPGSPRWRRRAASGVGARCGDPSRVPVLFKSAGVPPKSDAKSDYPTARRAPLEPNGEAAQGALMACSPRKSLASASDWQTVEVCDPRRPERAPAASWHG